MCHFSRLRVEEAPESATQRRRTAELESWVAADLASCDTRLTYALRQWRDSVVRRAQPMNLRPLVVRIPWIFVHKLDLPTQRVLLGVGDSVHIITSYRNRNSYTVGTELVPAQS